MKIVSAAGALWLNLRLGLATKQTSHLTKICMSHCTEVIKVQLKIETEPIVLLEPGRF
jgi:hypothetical protein